MNLVPMSGSEVDALRKDECPQLLDHFGRGTTPTWSTVVGTEGHEQGSSLLQRRGTRKTTLGIRKDRSQLADKTRQLQIEVSENHTRGHLIKIARRDLMKQ